MSTYVKLSACGAALAAFAATAGVAKASVNENFDCGGPGISITVTLEAETGTATVNSPRGAERLTANSDGVWRDADQVLQFFAGRVPPTLFLGSEQFSCKLMPAENEQTHASGAAGGGETMVNVAGRSLGGRLRNGPGTSFSPAGSLAEGTPVTIVVNTGVRFDGYDWFEIRTGAGKTAYQWGGIMCSEGRQITGIFEQCRGGAQNSAADSQRQGFMAFATGADGRFGHGKGQTRRDAEAYALQYCGAGCRVEDVTTARCHALAAVPGGMWFGAASTPDQAQDFAMGFCRSAGASGCQIDYSICQ